MGPLVQLIAWLALGQTTAQPVPQKHIPPTVLMELRQVEMQFDLSLSRDCAPEKCVSKGCVYRDHAVVDVPRNGSLPGLGQTEGPGAVPAQEYLTSAHCDFAHEKSVPLRDVEALVRRLEQRLSKGWLQVSVGRQILEPISPALSESPPPKAEVLPPKPIETPSAPPPNPKWEADVALRELWLSLLPHFSWMIAVVLGTLATLFIIWGLRRLGRESLEEKALLAQLQAGQPQAATAVKPEDAAAAAKIDAEGAKAAADTAFAGEQHKAWADRITNAELTRDEGAVVGVLRDWLKAGEFELLAKATLLFGDRLSLALSSDGELAPRKVAFAEYMRHLNGARLPSDAEFFRTLNQHSISSSLLAQSDTDAYRSLRDEFGAGGLAHLIEVLPARHGALLFALVPTESQQELARSLSPQLRVRVAGQLLASNRISREDRSHVFAALTAARMGSPLPAAPNGVENNHDRGLEFDAAGALSVLLPAISPADRVALFQSAYDQSSKTFPLWYEDILYPEMLLKLPKEVQADTLLDVDVKGLAGWFSVQPTAFQEGFLATLTPSMQNAVRANMVFASRAEQSKLAREGHHALVTSVKKVLARGTLSFAELVA